MPLGWLLLNKELRKEPVNAITLDHCEDQLAFELAYTTNVGAVCIYYQKDFDGTVISSNQLGKSINVGEEAHEALYEDFTKVFSHQLLPLKTLRIYFSDVPFIHSYPILIRCLEELSSSRKLKVINLQTTELNAKELASLIELLNPDELKTVDCNFTHALLHIADLTTLISRTPNVRYSIVLDFLRLSKDNLLEIKKLLCHSSSIDTLTITYSSPLDDEEDFFNGSISEEIITEDSITKENITKFFEPWTIKHKYRKFFFKFETEDIVLLPEHFGLFVLDSPISEWRSILGLRDYMKNILPQLDFFDVQRLRHVSWYIRKCIDELRPESRIKEYAIKGYGAEIETKVFLENGKLSRSNRHDIDWNPSQFSGKDWNSYAYGSEKTQDHNFKNEMARQRSCLDELSLRTGPLLLEKIGNALASREPLLCVKKLKLIVLDEKCVKVILPYLDVDSLKSIHLISELFDYDEEERTLDIAELGQLEQWMNAEEFIYKGTVKTPIQAMNINHFSFVDMTVVSITGQDIFFLKEALLKSSKLQKWKIAFKTNSIENNINTLLGQPHIVTTKSVVWYFNYSDTSHSLQVRYLIDVAVFFTHVLTSDI